MKQRLIRANCYHAPNSLTTNFVLCWSVGACCCVFEWYRRTQPLSSWRRFIARDIRWRNFLLNILWRWSKIYPRLHEFLRWIYCISISILSTREDSIFIRLRSHFQRTGSILICLHETCQYTFCAHFNSALPLNMLFNTIRCARTAVLQVLSVLNVWRILTWKIDACYPMLWLFMIRLLHYCLL